MKRKLIAITLVDGSQHQIELAPTPNTIGQPLNSLNNIGQALRVANTGFCIDPNAAEPVLVPPSQIKSVKLIQE